MISELYGIEFDWFAIDTNGEVGLFSTAGYGFVPKEIYPYYEKYYELTEKFELPNLGSSNVWKDYANYGFYVFDWKLHQGPYLKMENPNKLISRELKSEILRLPYVPVISVDFTEITVVNVDFIVS